MIIENRELFQVIYALIVLFICSLIVLKTDRMFKISDYQGLRYLRNAFFFYSIAFIIKFILGTVSTPISGSKEYLVGIMFLFQFFIITAGLFLLYSLVWKKLEKEKNYHSFLNFKVSVIYFISLFISILGLLFQTYIIMYISKTVIFLIIGIISFNNLKNKKKSSSGKYYFISVIIGLLAWVLITFLDLISFSNELAQIMLFTIKFIFFLLFLCGITKNKNG